MTRLESAARDYAIACLSGRGGDIAAANALEMVFLLQPAGALRDAEPWRRAERDPQGVMRITWCGDRRVRARVALYLRTPHRTRQTSPLDRGGPQHDEVPKRDGRVRPDGNGPGHSSAAMTGHYSHVAQSEKNAAVSRAFEVIRGGSNG